MIHEESYKENLQLKSNGTEAGTNLSVNDESLIVGFKIAGIGLNKVNKSTVQKIAEGAIGANNGTVLLKTTANKPVSFSLTTEDLKPGRYILNVGVWSNKRGERLVGFGQESIMITPQTPCSISTINGYNFNDINRNTIFDPGEVGLANWTIKLIGFDTCSGTMVDIATTTNATGYFKFEEVTRGRYILIENLWKGWIPTTNLLHIINIPSTPTIIEENFGNWKKKK